MDEEWEDRERRHRLYRGWRACGGTARFAFMASSEEERPEDVIEQVLICPHCGEAFTPHDPLGIPSGLTNISYVPALPCHPRCYRKAWLREFASRMGWTAERCNWVPEEKTPRRMNEYASLKEWLNRKHYEQEMESWQPVGGWLNYQHIRPEVVFSPIICTEQSEWDESGERLRDHILTSFGLRMEQLVVGDMPPPFRTVPVTDVANLVGEEIEDELS